VCVVVDEEENHRGLGGPSMSPRDVCGETAESEAGLFPAEAAESDIFWLILDVHRLFRMFFNIPSNSWNNRFFYYSLHPSTFRPSLLKFLCDTSAVVCLPLMIVACLLRID
jgi:hypothetical protein